jgi:hypothetical protein
MYIFKSVTKLGHDTYKHPNQKKEMKRLMYLFVMFVAVKMLHGQRLYFSTVPVAGKKDIVSFVIPDGWIKDNEAKGVIAHEILTKENDSRGMIFIQTIAADAKHQTPEALIVREKMMYDTRTTTIRELMPVTTEKKKIPARIVKISGSADGEQLVAFIPIKHGLVAITMCSQDHAFIEENVAAFESLIKSYELNPIINPPAFAEIVID